MCVMRYITFTLLRLFCCYHRQKVGTFAVTITVTNAVIVAFFQSEAIAIDGITFHIENNIYPHRILFAVCAPNHEEYT